MNDATKRVAEGWGFDDLREVEGRLAEDVEVDVLSLLLLLDIDKRLIRLEEGLEGKVAKLVADTTKLEEAINSLTGVEQSVLTAVTALKEEVATLEAGTISQEKVDSLTTEVNNAVTALSGAITTPETPAEETPAEPPAEPTPEGEPTPPAE